MMKGMALVRELTLAARLGAIRCHGLSSSQAVLWFAREKTRLAEDGQAVAPEGEALIRSGPIANCPLPIATSYDSARLSFTPSVR